MKKQAIFAISMLLSMSAAQAAMPAWMSGSWNYVSTKACACGAYVRDSKLGTKVGGFVGTQFTNAKASAPFQFATTRPYSAGAYVGSALVAEELVRRGLARRAVLALARAVKAHPYIAGGVVATMGAGVGATIALNKVPACVSNAFKNVWTDSKAFGNYIWASIRNNKKTTAGLIGTGILAELGHCWNKGRKAAALKAAKTAVK